MTLVVLAASSGLLAGESDPAPSERDGDRLVQSALQSLTRLPPLEAKVRQRATIMGQLLAGAGLYVQAPGRDQPLVRFELKMQVADQSLAVLQVNDGATLWIRRDDSQESRQSYVDLRQLREAARQRVPADPGFLADSGSSPGSTGALAMGGLFQLVQQLSENFDFGPPEPDQLSGISVWAVTGQWKANRLIRLLPGQKDRIESGQGADLDQLPDHLPTTVRLTLGRDRSFPLFPYRLEYSRIQAVSAAGSQTAGGGAGVVVRPLVTIEFYELRHRPDLSADFFRYSPGDGAVEDLTGAYLRQLQPPAPSAAGH